MAARDGLRVAILGATGSLGGELVAALDELDFPVAKLVPIASERSIGDEIELGGRAYPVQADVRGLSDVDLVFLCAPPAASLECARHALRARAACIDLSGALANNADVPLLIAELEPAPKELAKPLVAAPPGPALAWVLALEPIGQAVGLRRVVGTSIEAVSSAGRAGVESLSTESLALFNQRELPSPTVFPRAVAFDCHPSIGTVEEGGATSHESALASIVARLLTTTPTVAVTAVRVPTFAGDGAALAIETEEPLSAADAFALLEKAPGVAVWRRDELGPSTRAAVGRDVVNVGRMRPDHSVRHGLLLWLASDTLRLAALNAVRLAALRSAGR